MLPCVAVHLGGAEWKFTVAKLFKPLVLEETNEPKIYFNNWPWNMVDAFCNFENIPKYCLKQIETEWSHNYGYMSLKSKFVPLKLIFSKRGAVLSKFCRTKWRNNLWNGTKTLLKAANNWGENSLCSQYGLTSDLICVVLKSGRCQNNNKNNSTV